MAFSSMAALVSSAFLTVVPPIRQLAGSGACGDAELVKRQALF